MDDEFADWDAEDARFYEGIDPEDSQAMLAASLRANTAQLKKIKPYLSATNRNTRDLRWIRPIMAVLLVFGVTWYFDDRGEDAHDEEQDQAVINFNEEQRIRGCYTSVQASRDQLDKLEIYTARLGRELGATPEQIASFVQQLNTDITDQFPERDCAAEAEARQARLRDQGFDVNVDAAGVMEEQATGMSFYSGPAG